jgi:hypothetical protein
MTDEPWRMTRRMYLIAQSIRAGADAFMAVEVVASTAIEHPEWNMDERKTWDEWERQS